MKTSDGVLDNLSEMDRFVRLMAMSSDAHGVVHVVRAYLDSWPRERVRHLQKTDAGWIPFDEYQQPFPVTSVGDVHQFGGSVRIRCRELRASDMRIASELLELDLFFFFANESLAVHEPVRSQTAVSFALQQHGGLRQPGHRGYEHRI